MGHSLGEYAALVAAGVLPFAQALEAVSARTRELAQVRVSDPGRMAAVLAPPEEIEQVLATVSDGYVVVANLNGPSQSVIGGETRAVERAAAAFQAIGRRVLPLPVSHAFHTAIVSAATGPLRALLERLDVRPPSFPVVSNVTGEAYPRGANARPAVIDLLARQLAEPVQFAKGLRTLYAEGARVFVEVGPKRALQRLADEVFADDPSVLTLFTNHPSIPDVVAVSQAVCGMRAAVGPGRTPARRSLATRALDPPSPNRTALRAVEPVVRPPLGLCRPTGVTLERGRRVIAMADEGGVGLALARQLEARGVRVLLVERRPPEEELRGWLQAWLDEGPIHGVYWLPTLDEEPDVRDAAAFREACRTRVGLLRATVHALLRADEGREAFLIAGTRTCGLDGRRSPLGAAVGGFAKALRRERPDVVVKALHVPAGRAADIATTLVLETLADPVAVDVACVGGLRLSLAPTAPRDAQPGAPRRAPAVIVVSGANGRGVPAVVTAIAAAAPGGVFHLVEAANAPGLEAPSDLAPAIRAIERSGGRAFRYEGIDLREPAEADALGRTVAARSGPAELIVHADAPAIEEAIAEKPRGAFAFVFDTRVEGWRNLTRAVAAAPQATTAVVHSMSGRFGAPGHADAAAAEELLAAVAGRAAEPAGSRSLAIAWDRSPAAAEKIAGLLLGTGFEGEAIVTSGELAIPPDWDEAGGLDPGPPSSAGPCVIRARAFTPADGLRVDATAVSESLLDGERLAGHSVLSEGIALETLAETAAMLAPGWHVAGVEQVEFLAPVVLGGEQRQSLEAVARLCPDGRDVVAACRLLGLADGANGSVETTTFVAARVRLTATAPPPAFERASPHRFMGGLSGAEIYRVCLRAPAFRVLERAWRTNAAVVGLMARAPEPAGEPLFTAPRLFELCVQTAEVLDTGRRGCLAEPIHVDRVRLARPAAAANGSRLYAVVRPAAAEGVEREADGEIHTYDARVLDEGGNVYLDLHGCRTAPMAGAIRAEPAHLAALRDGIG
jgi:malonyl CoA-acyl carrier protein transacylase